MPNLCARVSGHHGAIVLMYHSVADASDSAWIEPANHVPADVFQEQMTFLAQHRRVISLRDLAGLLRAGRAPEHGTVVLTFDDGYLDSLTVAAPVLQSLNLPTSLFLPTGYVSREQNQWIDDIYAIFTDRTQQVLASDNRDEPSLDLTNPQTADAAYQSACHKALEASLSQRTRLIDELREQLKPAGKPPRLTMNWDEARSLQRDYPCISLGSHSVDHLDLSSASADDARTELQDSREDIARETGAPPNEVSFPYGRSSQTLQTLAAELGYKAACGQDCDPLVLRSSDPMALPRIVAPRTMDQFDYLTSPANTGLLHRIMR